MANPKRNFNLSNISKKNLTHLSPNPRQIQVSLTCLHLFVTKFTHQHNFTRGPQILRSLQYQKLNISHTYSRSTFLLCSSNPKGGVRQNQNPVICTKPFGRKFSTASPARIPKSHQDS